MMIWIRKDFLLDFLSRLSSFILKNCGCLCICIFLRVLCIFNSRLKVTLAFLQSRVRVISFMTKNSDTNCDRWYRNNATSSIVSSKVKASIPFEVSSNDAWVSSFVFQNLMVFCLFIFNATSIWEWIHFLEKSRRFIDLTRDLITFFIFDWLHHKKLGWRSRYWFDSIWYKKPK